MPLVRRPLEVRILGVLQLAVIIVMLDMTVQSVLSASYAASDGSKRKVLEGQVLLPVVHVPLDIPLLVQALVAVMTVYVTIVKLDMTVPRMLMLS